MTQVAPDLQFELERTRASIYQLRHADAGVVVSAESDEAWLARKLRRRQELQAQIDGLSPGEERDGAERVLQQVAASIERYHSHHQVDDRDVNPQLTRLLDREHQLVTRIDELRAAEVRAELAQKADQKVALAEQRESALRAEFEAEEQAKREARFEAFKQRRRRGAN
jgi:hypothetical protein